MSNENKKADERETKRLICKLVFGSDQSLRPNQKFSLITPRTRLAETSASLNTRLPIGSRIISCVSTDYFSTDLVCDWSKCHKAYISWAIRSLDDFLSSID